MTPLDGLLSFLLNLAAGYVLDRHAAIRQEEFDELKRALSAIEDLRSLREQLDLAVVGAARTRQARGESPLEDGLVDLFGDLLFRADLIQWLASWTPEERGDAEARVLRQMGQALKRAGASEEQIARLAKEYFQAVEAAVFRDPALVSWRFSLAFRSLHDRLAKLEGDVEREGHRTRAEVRAAIVEALNSAGKDASGWMHGSLAGLGFGEVGGEYVDLVATYLEWLRGVTASFRMLGTARVGLPVSTGWVELRVSSWERASHPGRSLPEEVNAYHGLSSESPAAKRDSASGKADDVAEVSRRLVVIGGPGSGKSTLCKRVAHDLAGGAERVLLVRLPRVMLRLERGSTFEEAVLDLALDGYAGAGRRELRQILAVPDCLIADGLDECGGLLDEVTEGLLRWAAARPNTRIVLTTRRVGYRAEPFGNWHHVQIDPLDPRDLRMHARTLLAGALDPSEAGRLEELTDRLETRISGSSTARDAARAPLFLGFLVQLTVSDRDFGRSRADLLGAIISDWAASEGRSPGPQVDPTVAARVLDIAGWCLHTALAESTFLPVQTLMQRISSHLQQELSCQALAAKRTAGECIAFWEHKGLLEHLHSGGDETITFAHLSLGEYCAARYASHLSAGDLTTWAVRVHTMPMWRDVLLLCADMGRANDLAAAVYGAGDPSDPISAGPLLAADLMSRGRPDAGLLAVLAALLGSRLKSYVPHIAFEAADRLAALAPHLTTEQADAVVSMYDHAQTWTRVCAHRVALASRVGGLDRSVLFRSIQEAYCWIGSRGVGGGYWYAIESTASDLVCEAAARLAADFPDQETIAFLTNAASRGPNSMFMLEALNETLDSLGAEKAWPPAWAETTGRTLGFAQSGPGMREADLAFLEAVIRVAGSHPDCSSGPRRPYALGTLVSGMGLHQAGLRDWLSLVDTSDREAADEVLRGMVAALSVDCASLAMEAALAYEQARRDSYLRLASSPVLAAPEVIVEPSWQKARESALDADLLVRGLLHASGIVAGAAIKLIANGVGAERAQEGVLRLIDSALGVTSRVAAPIRLLPFLSNAWDGRSACILRRALTSEERGVASSAARVLEHAPSAFLSAHAPWLFDALESWHNRNGLCDECGAQHAAGENCPTPHVVAANPRASLVKVLARVGQLDMARLVMLAADERRDVREAAVTALPPILRGASPGEVSSLIAGMSVGRITISVLDAVVNAGDAVVEAAVEELMALSTSERRDVRATLLRTLPSLSAVPTEARLAMAIRATCDEDIAIRNQAVHVLRSLRHESVE